MRGPVAGRAYGTIGGGAVEYRSEQVAAQVLRTRSSRTARFLLRRNQVEDLGMICGGDVTVYFHFIPGGDPAALEVADTLLPLPPWRRRRSSPPFGRA